MSFSKKGRLHPNWDKKLPDSTKLKMSKSQKGKNHSFETKEKIRQYNLGKKLTDVNRKNMSVGSIKRYSNLNERKKTSDIVKLAMHRPDVRKKHIEGLLHSPWLKVRTDKGQLELIKKWNKLGFHFEPNYQVHTDTDLFYVDGYDKEKNVVIEYDSKYHLKPSQQKKDLVRQNKILDILKPKKFWRYNSTNKQYKNILQKMEVYDG